MADYLGKMIDLCRDQDTEIKQDPIDLGLLVNDPDD